MQNIQLACGVLKITVAESLFRCAVKHTVVSRGVERVRITLSAAQEAALPQTELLLATPLRSNVYRWTPSGNLNRNVPADWGDRDLWSDMAHISPQVTVFDGDSRNVLSCAVSECERYVKFRSGIREEDNQLITAFALFSRQEAPVRKVSFEFYADCRSVFYADAMRCVTKFFDGYYPPAPVPAAARRPLYSTWYGFHQNLFAEELEKELKTASEQGFKCVIVDDGWHTEDNHRGFGFCGDWRPVAMRFKDFAAHVRNVHKLGMKYILWYSLAFVGVHSRNFARFKGKYLSFNDRLQTAILDPRFPDVREFLCSTYENALKNWDIDGLKLDFIDSFSTPVPDPAVKENYKGRDIKSVPEAVSCLMSEITRRLHAIKPEVLIEFRQSYIGHAIRQHGNMFRAADCPFDALSNRVRTIDLRLSCGDSAVHGDMLMFPQNAPASEAALQLLAVLFAVPQISVRYDQTTPAQQKMLKHYVGFMEKHIALLQKGKLRPLHPELLYPIVSSSRGRETLTAVYAPDQVAELGKTAANYLVNATTANKLTVRLAKPVRFITMDCTGKVCKKGELAAGLQEVDIPPAGMMEMTE